MATLRQKTKGGTWYITYREDGRQKTRSLKTTSRRTALKLRDEIDAMIEEGDQIDITVSPRPEPPVKNPEIESIWPRLREWLEVHRSQSTMEEYANWWNQVTKFTEAKRLGDITSQDIESFKTTLLRQGKHKPKGTGLKKSSVNDALKSLEAIWNHAIRLGLYTGENPVACVERFKIPANEAETYLDKEDVDALLKAAQRYRYEKFVRKLEARNVYLAIALAALAGLRKREVCYARWEWIDWKHRILRVKNEEDFLTKNRKPRVVSISQQLLQILADYRKDEGYILEEVRSSDAKAKYRADFKKSFKRVCELAGIETTPHQLRHSFASRHAVAGTSLHVIAGWLGHSTTWVTQRYAHFQTTYNQAADNI